MNAADLKRNPLTEIDDVEAHGARLLVDQDIVAKSAMLAGHHDGPAAPDAPDATQVVEGHYLRWPMQPPMGRTPGTDVEAHATRWFFDDDPTFAIGVDAPRATPADDEDDDEDDVEGHKRT